MSKVNNELEKLSSTGNDNEIFENKILTKEDKRLLKEDDDKLN